MREGAFESAGLLTERLDATLARLSGPLLRRALPRVISGWLMLGEHGRARALAQEHTAALLLIAEGVTLLELLGFEQAPLWLPGGRPNLVALNRRLGDGSMGVAELTALLRRRPWLWLQNPELDLLYFNALRSCDLDRACAFANRFLSLRGLSRCRPRAAGAAVAPFELMFEAPAKPVSGPLVSIVMAARNAAGSVCDAVDSLLAQSYAPLEILVGDDASEDDTARILRQRYAGESRVRLFGSRSNQGAYNLRNALFSRARGELLTCHDADDLALPSRIAAQVRRLERSGQVACVTSWLRVEPERGVVFSKDQTASRLCLVSLMLTRHALQSLGPLRSARVGADLERYAKLRARFGDGAIARIRAPLIWGQWSQGSVTRQLGSEALENGYRSPMRRAYGELIFAKHRAGASITEREMEERLLAAGNYLERSEIFPL